MRLFPGKRPRNLGVRDGRLAPCPDKPNCVSSQARGRRHAVDPLPVHGTPEASMQRLHEIVSALPRSEVIEATPDYLYAECATRIMGFVDDLEFHCDGDVIHVRSASRLGYSDLGVNRKRVERIRAVYEAGSRRQEEGQR